MAKKATSKPARRAAKAAAAAPVIPAPDGPAQSPEQGMAAPISTVAGLSPLAVDSPAEGAGGASPQVSLSEVIVGSGRVVTDHAGDTYEEGDLEPQDTVLDDDLPTAPPPPPAVHPVIEAARSYITPHGVPTGEHRYFTPPPPELRSKPKKV